MTSDNDPENSSPEPELGRRFYFKGKALPPYSFNHRAALMRLGSLTDYEFCTYLIRVLLLPIDRVDSIRGDAAVAAFRIETGQWADKENVSRGKGLDELQKVADEIMDDLTKAESLTPAAAPAGKKKKPKPKRRGYR